MKTTSVFILFCLSEINTVISQGQTGEQTDTSEMHVIELLIVVDYSVYVRWLKRVKSVHGNRDEVVEETLRYHYAYIMAGINERFSTIRNQAFSIRVDVIGVHILKEEEAALWTNDQSDATSLDAMETLGSFRRWIQNTPDIPVHDHAILFTWYDLTRGGSNTIAGMAYVGTMCTSSSYSVVEDNYSSLAHAVTTHELGHSLGSQHDGSGNACSSEGEGRYIMADMSRLNREAELNRYSWRFSKCSQQYMSDYIAKLNRNNKNCMLTTEHSAPDVTIATAASATTVNNMTLNLEPDDQCRQISGDQSYFCRNLYLTDYSDICGVLYCSETATTCNLRLPLDGTYCGHNKVCRAGSCIEDEFAIDTSVTENTCIHGDQPDMFLEQGTNCSSEITRGRHLCYDDNISTGCCTSCAAIVTGIEGCTYGDKSEDCSSTFRVRCILRSNECCQTCEGYGTKLTDLVIPITCGILSIVVILVVVCRKACRRKLANKAQRSRGQPQHRANQQTANRNVPKSSSVQEGNQPARQASQSPSIFISHDPYHPMNGQNQPGTSSQSPSKYRSLDELYYPMGDKRHGETMTTQPGNQSQLQWKSLEKIFFPFRQSSQSSHINPAYSEYGDSKYHLRETLKIR